MTWKVNDPVSLPVRLEDVFGRGLTFANLAAAQAAGWTFIFYQATIALASQPTLTLTASPDGEVGDFFVTFNLPQGVSTFKVRGPGQSRAIPDKVPLIVGGTDADGLLSFMATSQGTLVSSDRASQYNWEYVEGDTLSREMIVPASALADFGFTDLTDLPGGAWTVACMARLVTNPPSGTPPAGTPDFTLSAIISDKLLRKVKIKIPAGLTGAVITYATSNQAQFQYDCQLRWVESLAITGVSIANKTYTFAGDKAHFFPIGGTFTIAGSTGNNGTPIVASLIYDGANTVVTVTNAPASAVVDGTVAVAGKLSAIKGTITAGRQQTTSP